MDYPPEKGMAKVFCGAGHQKLYFSFFVFRTHNLLDVYDFFFYLFNDIDEASNSGRAKMEKMVFVILENHINYVRLARASGELFLMRKNRMQ